VPTAIADRITGLAAVNAVTAALFCRERTGKGQAVEVPMFETLAHMVLGDHMSGRTFAPPIQPFRYERMLAPHRVPYATKDGYVCVLVYNDKQWRSFFRLIGREEMFDGDPRFSSQEARSRNIAEVYAFVAGQMVARTSADWLRLLKEADIPATPLNSIEDVIDDPHLAECGFFVTIAHPTEGRLRLMRTPLAWSDAPPHALRPAPRLGEHSVEILREAGYADTEIESMIAARVTLQAEPPSAPRKSKN
jgi:crotonobetainyl-CoA:carnitine CoA-transferase CaiB-like acyl-CoA transferase